MIQVYTGDGKGKTTAALGLALRAVGHNLKVIMLQFMKGDINYGEINSYKFLPNFKIEQYGLPTFVNKNKPSKLDIELAQKGLERAKEIIKNGEADVLILDELNVALDFNLIQLNEVIELLNSAKDIEIVITGRYAPKEIIDLADLVSEVKEIKHYYRKGVISRKGFDF